MNKTFKNSDYIPQRVGLIFIPPIILIEYLIPSQQKLFQHKIKLQKLTEKSDVDDLVRYIKKRHQPWVDGKITDEHLETLITRLKDKLTSDRQSKSDNIRVEIYKKPDPINIIKQAQVEDQRLKKNVVKEVPPIVPPAFQLKLNVNITNFSGSYNSMSSSKSKSKIAEMGFEEIEYEDDDEDKQKASQESGVEEDYGEDFEQESVADVQEESQSYDYDTLNLNKMTPEEVLKHKNKMDVVYKQNIKRPGDTGYQYDVQKNFQQTKQSDWDEDD